MNSKNNSSKSFRVNRRDFLSKSGIGLATLVSFSPRFAFAQPFMSARKLRVGVVGGRFGLGFYFDEHPNCVVEAVSDLIPAHKEALMKTYKCQKSYESLEELIKDPAIEAVGVFTGAPDHARH